MEQTVRINRPDEAEAAGERGSPGLCRRLHSDKANRRFARLRFGDVRLCSGLGIGFGIEILMGIIITTKKLVKPEHVPVSRAANDDWPARTDLKQANSPKNERSHDTLTEFCLSN